MSSEGQPRRGRRGQRKRWLPWLGAALLMALIGIGFLPQPTPVETVRVTRGALRATVNEEGKTRIKHRFVVSAPVAGQLRRLDYKAGADVLAGQTVLATIDPLPPLMLDARNRALAGARRDVATANLEKARAAQQFAASELKRYQQLYADKTVSLQELESAQWRETAAAKDTTAAENTVREVEAELAEFPANPASRPQTNSLPVEVKAPVSGRVLRVFEESARVLTAGTPLVEIGDPADLEVVIEVLSRDGAAIQPGTEVELEQWGGGEPLKARVRLVEPAAFTKISALGVEEQRVNVVADLVTPLEQRRGLGDSFRVEARIVVWKTEDALKVPVGGLFRRGQEWAGFVIEDGRASLREVQVGRSSDREMQVVGGLKEGEEVILYPGERVRDGQRIRPIQVSP